MSAKSTVEDLPVFSDCENQVIEFESTWSLERYFFLIEENKCSKRRNKSENLMMTFLYLFCSEYEKAIPIPTQTDPVNKMEHKSTNTMEIKHNAVSNYRKEIF